MSTTTEEPKFSLSELEEIVINRGGQCNADHVLGAGSIRSYDHTGGMPVRGFTNKQWVYFECAKCGDEISIVHVLTALKVASA